MDAKAYRPDIDGLRAIAVGVVLLFHLDLAPFSGGFVGVDVFFVISGFLITNIILKEMRESGTFQFARFYIRRARRLFPALFVTQLAALIAAYVLLSPPDLERTGGALLHSLVSLSNMFFWSESGYFDAESDSKPLLHTWSLGVEEQFYLFWPLLLFLFLRPSPKWLQAGILTAVGVFSFYLNLLFMQGSPTRLGELVPPLAQSFQDGAATIFFLTPFRVFEFVIGALMVYVLQWIPRPNAAREGATAIGLALIAYAVFMFNEYTVFPAANALVPCLGAAFCIFGGEAKWLGKTLGNPVSVAIGKISYSVYLVHWPLIVYWKHYTLRELAPLEQTALAATTIALAAVMYRLVEHPFRYPAKENTEHRNARFALTTVLLTILMILPTSNIWSQDGWRWRFAASTIEIDYDHLERLQKTWHSGFGALESFSEERISAVVLGDSFGLDVTLMLDNHPDTEAYYEKTTGHLCLAYTRSLLPENMSPQLAAYCAANIERFQQDYHGADVVILADNYSTWDTDDDANMTELLENIDTLRLNGFQGPIVIYGERPIYEQPIPVLANRYGRVSGFNEFAAQFIRTPIQQMHRRVERAIEFYPRHDIYYYSPLHLMCTTTLCNVFTDNGEVIYVDNGHFSVAGYDFLQNDFINFLKSIKELEHINIQSGAPSDEQ